MFKAKRNYSKRVYYDTRDRIVLDEIVRTAEGGRLLAGLMDRDGTKNQEKSQIWTEITELFCQVRYLHAVVGKLLL
jgi:hypothetical protein